MNVLSIHQLAVIYKALKFAGHWYIVYVGPWSHPLNTTPNCLAILFDGFVQCKFSVGEDGTLMVAEKKSEHYLSLTAMGFAIGQTITINQLVDGIVKHRREGNHGINVTQRVPLSQCRELVIKGIRRMGEDQYYEELSPT